MAARRLTDSLIDPQIKLAKALIKRDVLEFREALKIGANALAKDEHNLCIFEKCLQTPGCALFIRECLLAGCDPNHLNTFYDKAAINFASDSRDSQNLGELLSSPGVDVNHKYSDLTPLNSLAKNLNNSNASHIKECMKILLRYGASPNIPDQREMTPLHVIIKNRKINDQQKYELVQIFLNLIDIDIDTYREGELRKMLEIEYPLMELPGPREHKLTTYHALLSAIRSGNINLFQQLYQDKSLSLSKDEQLQLLVASIERGVNVAFDMLMTAAVDYNRVLKHNNTAIEIAWIYGNSYALEKLLQLPDIKIRAKDYPLINIVCKLNQSAVQDFCSYWKCFFVLLDSDKIDINATDFSRSTALHYAVRYHNNKAVKELLNRGACISIRNKFNDLPLNGMCPAVWQQHLDDCITSSDDKYGDKSYEIVISFKNFLTSQQKYEKQLKEVLSPIAFMAHSKEYRYLLQHPVITSILYLKWHKLSCIFYVNFLCFIFFAISIIMYVVLKLSIKNPDGGQHYELFEKISLYCSYLGIGYFISREFVQFLVAPLKYLKSITNYLEILLILLVLLTCGIYQIEEDLQRNVAVACILLLAYELFLVVGSLPVSSISTHMLMLEAVCKSFIKSFLLYSIFIFTFALCFYIKIGVTAPAANGTDDSFHRFNQPLVAISKTIVMFTGEFDAGSLNLDSIQAKLLFLAFVFFMTIILFNLLNGLAVSDTQAIKDQAELNEIICRANLLHHYEKVVFSQTHNLSFILKRQPFRLLCKMFEKLYPDYTTDIQISILPNDKNRILGSKAFKKTTKNLNRDAETNMMAPPSTAAADNESDILFSYKFISCWFSYLSKRCMKIDERTVTQAMAILQRKSTPSIENRLDFLHEQLNKLLTNFGLNEEN